MNSLLNKPMPSVLTDSSASRAREKIAAFIEHFVPEPLSHGLKYLVSVRNPDGGWGRVSGSVSDVRNTALALKVFLKNQSYLKFGEFEDAIEYLRNHLSIMIAGGHSTPLPASTTLTVQEFALASILLRLTEQDVKGTLQRQASQYFNKLQNEDGGWGGGTSNIDTTSSVLLALSMLKSEGEDTLTIRKGLLYLEATINEDGGFGFAKDSLSNSVHTAKGLLAIAATDIENAMISKSVGFLVSQQQVEGYWGQEDQSDVVYATALTLKALISALQEKNNQSIHKGVRFLQKNQRQDGGWGWAVGDISEVEPTATVIDCLLQAGVTEYLPVSTSMELLKGAFEENNELALRTRAVEKDIDAQVRQRITNILETRDKLEERVKRLETENKRLARQQAELERLRLEATELQTLRLERLQIQETLEAALQIFSGRSDSPSRILIKLENALAASGIQQDEEAIEVVNRMFSFAPEVSAIHKKEFIESFRERLSTVISPSIAEEILSYLGALPWPLSSQTRNSLKRLMTRIQDGKLRIRALSNVSGGLSLAIVQFESAIANWVLDDKETAGAFLNYLYRYVPDLTTKDAKLFAEHATSRYISRASEEEVNRIQISLANIIASQSGKERFVQKQLKTLMARYSIESH